MKRLTYVVAALLLLAAAPSRRIEIAGTPMTEPNREILASSLQRAVPPGTALRVIVIDREVATRTP